MNMRKEIAGFPLLGWIVCLVTVLLVGLQYKPANASKDLSPEELFTIDGVALDSSGIPSSPDSAYILATVPAAKGNITTLLNLKSTTFPFADIGVDTTNTQGMIRYQYIDTVSNIVGAAAPPQKVTVVFTLWTKKIPTLYSEEISLYGDTLNEWFDPANYPTSHQLAAEITDSVWEELQSGHTTAGTFGRFLDGQISTLNDISANDVWAAATRTLTTADWTTTSDLSSLATAAQISALNNVSTNDIWSAATRTLTTADWATAGDLSGLATSAEVSALNNISVADVWGEAQSGYSTPGTFGYYLDDQVSNAGSGGGISAADVWGYGSRTLTTADWTTTADLTSLATSASIAALNDVAASEIYSYFTQGSNADAFKADNSLLALEASIQAIRDSLQFLTSADVSAVATQASLSSLILKLDTARVYLGAIKGAGRYPVRGADLDSITVKLNGTVYGADNYYHVGDSAGARPDSVLAK